MEQAGNKARKRGIPIAVSVVIWRVSSGIISPKGRFPTGVVF
jgi:hypothetical protein